MTELLQNAEGSRFIGTSNHGFAQYAQEEVRRLLGEVKFINLVPTEVFLLTTPVDAETVVSRIVGNEPLFLRHLQPVQLELDVDGGDGDLALLQAAIPGLVAVPEGAKVAVQARKKEGTQLSYNPFAVKEAIDAVLTSQCSVEPAVKDPEWIISVYCTQDRMYVGLSRPEHNLSDWSGGAIRFQKEDSQISRAKFKLLEAEKKFGLLYDQYTSALDIGAAPGGWTSLLLERGLKVTAVDPAKLHPDLKGHPQLTYLQKNADEVKFQPDSFDLLVCDMSWSPRQMGRLISNLLYALRGGGTAIITVKLMHKKPFQTVRELTEQFSDQLVLQGAKQLFHNREELTLFLTKL